MYRIILVSLLLALVSAPAFSKTLYVDGAQGDDSVSYAANSAERPWRTIGRAAWGSTNYAQPNTQEAARAGDEVRIAAGIYWETGDRSGGRFTVSLNPANSGTASNPIIFRGEGLVYIRLQAGYRGGMIGCNSRNYIVWDNFQIDDYYGGSTSDTGPVVFSGARHCQIINSDIKGHPGSYYHGYSTFGGNYRGISLEPAHNITIRNNRIYQFRGGQNEAGVMAYDSNDNVIEHNEFFDNGTAVFIKGVHPGNTQARNIIRKNLVYNNWSGIRVLSSQDAMVYQNVVINNSHIGIWAGFFGSTRSRIVNNTIDNNESAFVPQGTDLVDVLFHGNIVSNNRQALYNWDTNAPSAQDVRYDRNLYYNNARHANYESGSNISLASWQSTYRLDTNGSSQNPLFVDAASRNYRLRANSPARTLSIDILDLNGNGSTSDVIPAGAYITGNETIGRINGGASAAAPNAPSGLTLQRR